MFGSSIARPLVEVALLASCASAPAERGIALGLFSREATFDYAPLVQEIVETGATHIEIVWVWWQDDARSTEIRPVEALSPTKRQVLRTIRQAKRAGLHVTAFPIIRLLHAGDGEWRGKIQPVSEDAWWTSYGAFVLESARWARRAGADRFSVGSELLSREPMRSRWLDLIDRVRVEGPTLELLYSANWDHYRPVSFWDAVDVIGLTGYYELTRDLEASETTLQGAWERPRGELLQWSEALGRPFVFTEVGYPSLDGGAAWPWDETREAPVDLEEQVRAYRAFIAAWSDTPALAGVYFWNWFGFGGATDGNYTPRGKPAAEAIGEWFTSKRSNCTSSLRL